MIPARQAIGSIHEAYPQADVQYVHPSLYVVCVDQSFSMLPPDGRDFLFRQRLGGKADEIFRALQVIGATLCLISPAERAAEYSFLDESARSYHWLGFLAGARPSHSSNLPHSKIIHWYGFKGGQARSTLLTVLAKALANDGYRVLTIDADVEAPSLHQQFKSAIFRPDSTLLGCVQYDLEPFPQSVYVPLSSGRGKVDLIACKPSGDEFDLDLAAFALQISLNPAKLQEGFRKLISSTQDYDVILVDHRSGISSPVAALTAAFPGPIVICARLDEQSDEADSYFRALLAQNPDTPGLYVSFSLDPDETEEKLRNRGAQRIESLLSILANAMRLGASESDSDEEVRPEDLMRYWVPWFHDRNFLSGASPSFEGLFSDNKASISRIREILRLEGAKKGQGSDPPRTSPRRLTSSGSTDQGILIQTEALRRLAVPNTPITYILGRKGTGKTRIVRELVERELGWPLLAADDFQDHDVINSSDPTIKDLADLLRGDAAEKLWWILLDAVTRGQGKRSKEFLSEWLERIRDRGIGDVSISAIVTNLLQSGTTGVYLIDGVETAFHSSQISIFVEGLFRFLASLQSNRELARKVTVRLFIRTDLVRLATENIEQQIEGRELRLSWNTQSILNFALSRVGELSWFVGSFSEGVKRIQEKISLLEQGALPESDCNELLLEIFPEKLRRNNLLTLTFLKDYFSEGVGENASYYPRIYDTFLRDIADPGRLGGNADTRQVEDGRVAQPLIIAAHDHASKEYLMQVAAELKNLVELADDPKDSQERVQPLIKAFAGLPTPFDLEKCTETVHNKLLEDFPKDPVQKERVRSALEQMKRIGIFEDRPKYPGMWRVGRLFKTALDMRYVRG